MNTMTLTCIKADIGSVGGHLTPSRELLDAVRAFMKDNAPGVVKDWDIVYIGDDISLLMVHDRGAASVEVHRLAMDCLNHGAQTARAQALYGAGQDIDEEAFSGNVRGLGPAVAELEFKPRDAEPFVLFAADKTDCGAYNLPLYLAYADPFHCPGLMLAKSMAKGFSFRLLDVEHVDGDRIIELNAPEDLYDIATLLRDNARYHVESIRNRKSGEIAVRTSAARARIVKGKMKGKDDPVMICRAQGDFPSSGEIIGPFALGHFTGGSARGSHNSPLMPVRGGTPIGFFDGPAMVCARAYSVCPKSGKLSQAVEMFDSPFFDTVREDVSRKFVSLRQQGFSGPAMLGTHELEYGGVADKLHKLQERFTVL